MLRVEAVLHSTPASIDVKQYVLFIASAKATASISVAAAREWLDAGAAYVCARGPSSREIEEAFDYASFLPELGSPFPFTVMTTSHREETIEEALWFAFYNATPPDDLKADLNTVIMLVDSPPLEKECESCVNENTQ
jgi:hypothetical protein